MADWFFEQSGGRHGPHTIEELRALYSDGKINDSTLTWDSTFGREWKKLRDADVIGDDGGSPPLPPGYVTNVYAWLIALIPVLGAVAEKVVGDTAPGVEKSTGFLLVAYSIAYIFFGYLDGRQIKASGRTKDVTLLGWIWFAPVYLVQRARAIGEKQYLTLVWVTAVVAGFFITSPELFKDGTYFGVGLPACDSPTSKKQVTDIFGNIPLVKQSGIAAVRVMGFKELAKTKKTRSCSATVEATNIAKVPVTYSITDRDDQIYYEVQIAQ